MSGLLIIRGTRRPGHRVQAAMTLRRIAAFLAASVALALAGCAGNTAGSSSPIGGSASAPASAGSETQSAGTKPSSGSSTETLSGTVAAGVEPNCLILQSADSHHVLIFGDPALRSQAKVGSSITVTGRAEPGQMTTCQQGVPFIVATVRAN
jgi:hypothetical protein